MEGWFQYFHCCNYTWKPSSGIFRIGIQDGRLLQALPGLQLQIEAVLRRFQDWYRRRKPSYNISNPAIRDGRVLQAFPELELEMEAFVEPFQHCNLRWKPSSAASQTGIRYGRLPSVDGGLPSGEEGFLRSFLDWNSKWKASSGISRAATFCKCLRGHGVHNTAAVVGKHYKDEQNFKPDRVHREEIDRRELRDVVV